MAASGTRKVRNRVGRTHGGRHGHFHKAAKPLATRKAFGRNKKRG